MEATKQYQVRLNGNLILQSDRQPEAGNPVICTIYSTLIFAGLKYTKEWIKEQQGDYIREAPIMDEYTRKRNAYYRAKALYMDLICEGWLQDLPRDEHKRYKELAKFYAKGEEWAVEEMTDIYQRYLQRLNG